MRFLASWRKKETLRYICLQISNNCVCSRREDSLSCLHGVEPPLTHSINVYYVITDKQCGASDRGYAGNMTVLSNKHLEWSYRTQVTHGRISGFLILYTSNSLWGFFCDSDTMSVYKDVFIPRAVSARGGGGGAIAGEGRRR